MGNVIEEASPLSPLPPENRRQGGEKMGGEVVYDRGLKDLWGLTSCAPGLVWRIATAEYKSPV